MLNQNDCLNVANYNLRVMLKFTFNNIPNGDVCYVLEYKYSHLHRAEFTVCPAQDSMFCSIDLSDKKITTMQDIEYHMEFVSDVKKIFYHLMHYGLKV